ncbi:Gfo/Idh/MocA family oxidoreductase [Candidatus Pacearchaeota archaeon]|nr:Gfo/Idh/MocA family oxidoreductase [Candidatus Pacearchaeota archaeon]
MKIIFFGLGSIGLRHARLIKNNFDHELYAYRSSKKSEKNSLGIKEIFELNEIDRIKPDVAFITNPTNKHVEYATYCARKGINLFIEKPLSNDKQGIPELLKAIKEKNIVTYTAYCLRFHPAIIWLKKYLKENKPLHINVNASSYLHDWRENVDPLKHFSAFKDQGGGIILELSHEIDYLYYLFGDIKKLSVNSEKISDVTIDAEDFVDILLQFKNNVFANVHINFLSRLWRREIIIDFKDRTIISDIINHTITIIKDKKRKTLDFEMQLDDMFLEQLEYFFNHLQKGKPMNNITESLKVFDILMQVKNEANLL